MKIWPLFSLFSFLKIWPFWNCLWPNLVLFNFFKFDLATLVEHLRLRTISVIWSFMDHFFDVITFKIIERNHCSTSVAISIIRDTFLPLLWPSHFVSFYFENECFKAYKALNCEINVQVSIWVNSSKVFYDLQRPVIGLQWYWRFQLYPK